MSLRIVLAAVAMLLVTACASDADSAPAAPTPTPTPTARPVDRTAPTPTPLPDVAAAQAAVALQRFGGELAVIDTDWQTFRTGFDDWRQSIEGCDEADRRADLRGWVVDFQAVELAATGLDFPSGTLAARDSLTTALTLEGRGLHKLRDEWAPDSDEAFAVYDSARTQASIGRQEARARLAELIAIAESEGPTPTPAPPEPLPPGIPPGALPPAPPEGPLADPDTLGTFKEALEASGATWDAFHRRFDEWRRSDGDCAQGDVRDRLAALARDYGPVLGRVSAVVRPSVVRPLAEQLIEAAVSEAAGLAELRDTWTAYDAGSWRAYDAARRRADDLRRQVRSSLDELNLQYDVSPS